LIIVEPGIGYANETNFARWKVWESYALYHAHCGLEAVRNCKQDNYSVVIPNYFDPEDFIYKEKKDDYYLFIGRVYTGKGVHIAIDAAKRAGVKLIIAGQLNGDYKLPPLSENVTYVGYADIEMRKTLMANAKALLIPSQYLEPFGGVQIESLFSGTPIITSDWGAFAECNLHNVTGYRCRTMGDYVEAIQNIEKGRIDSRACREWAENYSLEAVAPKYEKYFNDVLDVYTGEGWYTKSHGIASMELKLPRSVPQLLLDT
jgi:glycosyltransferase involved in cell wall biosynthesis